MAGLIRAQSRGDLAYAENAGANQTGIGSADTDATALSITFTVISRPVYVTAQLPLCQQVASNGIPVVKITDGSGTEKARTGGSMLAAVFFPFVPPVEKITTPGTYTRKVMVSTSAGTLSVLTATAKSLLRAYEV